MVFPLGALVAGDPAGAYQRGRLTDQDLQVRQLQLQDLQDQPLVESLYGTAIPRLFGSDVPGAGPIGGAPLMPYGLSSPMGPAPPPGAPQMGGPPMATAGPPVQEPLTADRLRQYGMSSLAPRFPGPGTGPEPNFGQPVSQTSPFAGRFGQWEPGPAQAAGLASAMDPQGGALAGSMRSAPAGAFPPGGVPYPGATTSTIPPPQPGQMGGQQGQLNQQDQQGHPGLTWQQVIQTVAQSAPPGTPPRIIAKAVNAAIPLMNSQSAMEYKAIQAKMMGLRAQQLTGQVPLTAGDEARAQAIAAYREGPITGYAGTRGTGLAIMQRAFELNPNYDEKRWRAGTAEETSGARVKGGLEARTEPIPGGYGATLQSKSAAQQEMARGKIGTVVVPAFNTLTGHLDELRDVAQRLENGDVTALNTFKNYFSTQVGNDMVTNFNSVRDIVGDEIVRAVLGGAGNVFDRSELQSRLSSSASRRQLMGAIDKYINLATQRLGAIDQWYKANTGSDDFKERFLTPRTRKLFGQDETTGQAPASGLPPGWSVKEH